MSTPQDEILNWVPHLRRYARSLVGDPVAADDLVQDGLVRALSGLHTWQPGTNMRAWLFTIMHNVFIDQARRRARQSEQVSEIPRNQEPSAGPRQEDTVQLGQLERALLRISPEHRSVLILVTVNGMSYEETAQILDVPVGTIRSRLSRARQALREVLNAPAADAPELPAPVRPDPSRDEK